MAYKNWKLMDEVSVAIKTSPDKSYYGRTFDGYVVESTDENALNSAKSWARETEWDRELKEYTKTYEPDVHTFKNEGFTAKILDSAGGSSQGGRLSFWSAEVEKDGVKFTIGVNDAILADLIRNSHIVNGVVQEKVMFARKGGQPGLIHEGMDSYKDATADMAHKKAMNSAKKTSKWEIGGVYSSITMSAICIGEVFDTYEEYTYEENAGYWTSRTRHGLRKAEKPKKMYAWLRWPEYKNKDGKLKTFEDVLKNELKDRDYVYFEAGKPPARAKTDQLEVKDSDLKLIDKILSLRTDGGSYYYTDAEKIKGRYIRTIE